MEMYNALMLLLENFQTFSFRTIKVQNFYAILKFHLSSASAILFILWLNSYLVIISSCNKTGKLYFKIETEFEKKW